MKNRNLTTHRNLMPIRRNEVWQPLQEMSRLQGGIDQLFEDFLSPLVSPLNMQSLNEFVPPMDLEESEDHFIATFDLPGVPKDAVKVEVRDNRLIVSGERIEEHHEGEKGRQYTERFTGSFQRVLALPAQIDPEQITAEFQDGVLRLILPKAAESKPRQIKIGESKKMKAGKEQAA